MVQSLWRGLAVSNKVKHKQTIRSSNPVVRDLLMCLLITFFKDEFFSCLLNQNGVSRIYLINFMDLSAGNTYRQRGKTVPSLKGDVLRALVAHTAAFVFIQWPQIAELFWVFVYIF